MSQVVQQFLTRCFDVNETIGLFLRSDKPASITQRLVRLGRVVEPRYQAWLSIENSRGANIYFAANPLRPGSRRRVKENIASVRHLYMDIDMDGEARLATLLASNSAPSPNAILSTSHDKYQVLWRVSGFDFERQEQTLKLLASAFGGDPACTDRNRVLRLPGFLNQKYDPPYRVTANILAILSGLPPISIWRLPRQNTSPSRADSAEAGGPRSTAIRKKIGHGSPTNLPTAKMLPN